MNEIVLVKLGGSLLTDKRGEASPRLGVIERLAADLSGLVQRLEQELARIRGETPIRSMN